MNQRTWQSGSAPILAFRDTEAGWDQSMGVSLLYPYAWTGLSEKSGWFYLFVKGYPYHEI